MAENEENPNKFPRLLLWIAVVFVVFAAYRAGVDQGRRETFGAFSGDTLSSILGTSQDNQKDIDLSLFWRSWNLLKSKFVDSKSLTNETLTEGAIRGLFEATEDPYTVFLNAQENQELEEDISGSFDGIGAEIGIRDKILTIIAPSDSPAERAGLRAKDKILKVDEEETADMTLNEAVRKLHGEKGTDVTMTIFREGDQDTRQITVTRDTIEVKSVAVEYRDGGIAYVQLTRFGDDTADDFRVLVAEMKKRLVQGIVLDMRNNPGGRLDTSVEIAGKFLEDGSLVVQEEYGNGKKNVEKTRGNGDLKDVPLVVLVNEGSASAAEILAGSLKDNRQEVMLVGKKTFGKGSVQEWVPLPDNQAAKITVAKWFTPSGNGIDNDGIVPDVEVNLTDDDFDAGRDPQLDKALEIVRSN